MIVTRHLSSRARLAGQCHCAYFYIITCTLFSFCTVLTVCSVCDPKRQHFRWWREFSHQDSSQQAEPTLLLCSSNKYQPTCDDLDCYIRCEYWYVKDDGTHSNPVLAVTPRALTCDPRVKHIVERHISACSLGFSILELVGKPGFASWQPRKVFAHPTHITLKSLASATAPASFILHRLSPTSNISIKEDDQRRSILTIEPGLVLHLSSENLLKRDVFVMVIRHWMYVCPPHFLLSYITYFESCRSHLTVWLLTPTCSLLLKYPPPPVAPTPSAPPPPSPPLHLISDPAPVHAPLPVSTPPAFDTADSDSAHNLLQEVENSSTPAVTSEQHLKSTQRDHSAVLPAVSSSRSRKRRLESDECTVSAAPKQSQSQRRDRLFHSSGKNQDEDDNGITTDSSPKNARKRASVVDEFGLTKAERKTQLKVLKKIEALKKIELKALAVCTASSAAASCANDGCEAVDIDLDDSECQAGEVAVHSSGADNVYESSRVDSRAPATWSANADGTARKSLKGRSSKCNVSSSACNQMQVSDRNDGETRIVDRNSKKSKSKKLAWPSVAQTGALCQAGCENRADAHFSCSHDFCSHCLVGIRKHQKTKKSEDQKL